ncbi:MAG TPA: arginine repressor [Clostridia bacterium]|nr:arginine repressor [Clostridia bacterium]
MKQSRHKKIIELIKEHDIGTQEMLLEMLRKNGFDVTQATVSRDIKELRLVKTLSKNGEYIYSTGKMPSNDLSAKFDFLLNESVIKVDYVMNQVIIKCYAGHGNALCEIMDVMHFEKIVGSLAGDNTIFVIMRNEQDAKELYDFFIEKLS